MSHEFELQHELSLAATPEQVWEAIATGPGIDSWFMGRNQVDNGVMRTAFGDYNPANPITAWEPGKRLASKAPTADDGRFIAYEFLIEGRSESSTVVRIVTSGFLPGDDWENEFEAMRTGLALFYATLAEYLTHFTGRTAVPVTAFGTGGYAALVDRLGDPATGDTVTITPPGQRPARGVVYHTSAQTLGIRTADAMYRFVNGFGGGVVAQHHLFAPGTDPDEADRAWTAWLAEHAS
ncbi:SRPBCC domain-containing protein [Nonomuraea sp. NPDC003804]|uniref:SRPBCC family protein n=1 Tax=Nonomuraea sp. NPDC003804 TaxID=3154547 RepID=UPI0033B89055